MRGVLASLFLATVSPVLAADAAPDFLGQTERPAQFSGYTRAAAYVPARDGVKLAVTYYLPVANAMRFPVLLWYHPGHRESIDVKTGAIRPTMSAADVAFWTSHGYGVAIAEMRGSGASFGRRELDRGPQIGRDGKDIVDWIAAQPWSDGAVGMIGASYQGFAQYATAAQRPAALKAIFPEIAGFDDYTSMFYPGGILVSALSASATESIRHDDQNDFLPEGARPHWPSVPVIDEDGDGELADEIPVDKDGDGSFIENAPPIYADGKPREGIYYKATLAHMWNRNLPVEDVAAAPHRDSPIAGTLHRWLDLDPGEKPLQIAASGIAVYNRGGWFDYHARDTAMWFVTLQGRTPTRLLMAPVGHGGLPADAGSAIYRAGPYLALFGDTRSTNQVMNREKLAFFDHYVKGLANGFDKRPPVLLYVMGTGWRYEHEWPLKRAVALRLSFGDDRTLMSGAARPGSDIWRTDLSSSSETAGASRWNFGISTARRPLSFDGRAGKRLAYTGAVLAADTEVTGHPVIDVVLSSSEAESDVFAYLEDVAPDGTSLLVTEGQLRANYAALKNGGPAPGAKPVLPWHRFAKADYRARPFSGGKVLKLRFDLMPTSWLFRQGHRIRVSLAAADAGSFAGHPGLGDDATTLATEAIKIPVWTVRRGPGLSGITLPVIPRGK